MVLMFHPYIRRYSDGSGWDVSLFRHEMKERVGRDYWWPFGDYSTRPREEPDVLDYVEALHDLALDQTLPTSGHSRSVSAKPNCTGRAAYTLEVNDLFVRFNQPYRVVRGRVLRRGSVVLDRLVEEGLPVADEETERLLTSACKDFYFSREDRRLAGLRTLADAFERIKTHRLPGRGQRRNPRSS